MERAITGDEFHEILKRIIDEKIVFSELLSIPEVYEVLSEKYNNEIIQAWEEETFSLDNNKLYSFTVRELNGEREYSSECLVTAKNLEEAQEKTTKYCKNWYPGDTTSMYDDSDEVFYFDNECVSTVIDGLCETSKEEWVKKVYAGALIS